MSKVWVYKLKFGQVSQRALCLKLLPLGLVWTFLLSNSKIVEELSLAEIEPIRFRLYLDCFCDIMNQLHAVNQDGPKDFVLESGGYFIGNGKITISVETRDIKPESDAVLLLCLENHPFSGKFSIGDVYQCIGGGMNKSSSQTDEPMSWGYHYEHHMKNDLRFEVLEIDNDLITFRVDSTHDDLNFYGSKAKDCITSGVVQLREVKKASDLWNPS